MNRRLTPIFLSGLLAVIGGASSNADEVTAVSANDFLNSIGANVHIQQGQPAPAFVEPLKYTGVRAIRDCGGNDVSGLLLLHQQAGVLVVFGPGSGPNDGSIPVTIRECEQLARAGALLAVEGPNEPNNFGGVTYHGQNSDKIHSWVPVADFQRDICQDVKGDPILSRYPVFGVSEPGAESDNSGLQYLTIPEGIHTTMPPGTQFSDYLNCHNYVCGHINGIIDNQATLAASTKPNAAIDHLFGNNGITWAKHYMGYTKNQLDTMPKVTTETGWKTDNTPEGDDRQGKVLTNVYLAQYKAGWKYTFIYEFADDPDGPFGFYHSDYTTPRVAAKYLHNLTTILADTSSTGSPGTADIAVDGESPTVHHLLLQKHDGTFDLVVWGEKVSGSSNVTVSLGGGLPYPVVKVYDITGDTTPAQTLKDTSSVPLTISDHAMIVEFK